jgi:hypothetical protein
MWRRGREVGRNSAMYKVRSPVGDRPHNLPACPTPTPLRSARPLFSYAASFQGRDAHLPWTHQSSLCKLRGDKYKLSNTESGVQDNLIAASCDSDSVNHTGESKELVPIIFINHHQDGFLYASPFLLPRLNNDAGRRISFRHILEEVWR